MSLVLNNWPQVSESKFSGTRKFTWGYQEFRMNFDFDILTVYCITFKVPNKKAECNKIVACSTAMICPIQAVPYGEFVH